MDHLVDLLLDRRWTPKWDNRQQSRKKWMKWGQTMTWLWVMTLMVMAQGQPSKDGVCQGMEIRNNVNKFQKLRGCRVIEGALHILLIDNANESEYHNLSFPELTEVTGYVLLYRVYGLRTLRHIFPNLAVIRGNKLFFNYAFVVFEVIHMQEIGLSGLTDILKGSVRIAGNSNLCYVNTVDWDIIAKDGKGGHFIKGNKASDECPDICPKDCPKLLNSTQTLCWSSHHCQTLCDHCEGKACYGQYCCHEQCLGGCSGPLSTDCFACRHAVLDGNCVDHCSIGSKEYLYLKRRCVTESECLAMPPPTIMDIKLHDTASIHWKPFNFTCTLNCPPGYEEVTEGGKHTCGECKGKCQKECNALLVNSISAARRLQGCTHIRGSLQIRIEGGKNVIKELEDNLGAIEEVDDYVKISWSFPLVSLDFLKSLRFIHGKKPEKNRYALVVYENQNLHDLWDWSNREHKLRIGGKGNKMRFHFNPKLCLEKIEMLLNVTGLPPAEDADIASNSNGDNVACGKLEQLNLVIHNKSSTNVTLQWDRNFRNKLDDDRTLLGYMVSYTEAPDQNISLYEARGARDGWKVDDVPTTYTNATIGPKPEHEAYMLQQLKPFTQYAVYVKTYPVYVKTYTVTPERIGAESNIVYFTTHPDTPSAPVDLQGHARSPSQIAIVWKAPLHPKGQVTYYNVYLHLVKDDRDILDQRDYCKNPQLSSFHNKVKKKEEEVQVDKKKVEVDKKKEVFFLDGLGKECCQCPKDKLEVQEQVVQSKINFEDFVQDQVYVKKLDKKHERRSVQDQPQYRTSNTNFTIENLTHFTKYNIAVEACRDRHPEIWDDSMVCSSQSLVTIRTLSLSEADLIDSKGVTVQVSNNTSGKISLKWEAVKLYNGLVLAYHIEYKRADIPSAKPTVECITRKQFEQRGRLHEVENLAPGNYSLRLAAASLAGVGKYTAPRYVFLQGPAHAAPDEVPAYIVGAITVGVLLTGVVVAGAVYYYRKSFKSITNGILFASVNPEYASVCDAYVLDEWEIPRSKVELTKELGQGSFGMVYEGVAMDLEEGQGKINCAVKTVNENASTRDHIEFLNEASVMKAFNCHHIVKLLGVVSQGQPTLVVMELMASGDLKSYLRSHRPDCPAENPSNRQPPTLKRVFQMAAEIADGMAYLAAKKFVHRDLAARNCMVAEDLTVKIGDFGMTRDIYETDYYRKGSKGLLPVRWMSPESLKDGVFTSQTDVWSYGVVLWEMATLAMQPYQGLSNEQVLCYITEGGIMEQPVNCPKRLYELMTICWEYTPNNRPNFMELISLLLLDVSPEFHQVSFYHGEEALALRAKEKFSMYRQRLHEESSSTNESEDMTEEDATPLTFLTPGIGVGLGSSGSESNDYEEQPGSFTDAAEDGAIVIRISREGSPRMESSDSVYCNISKDLGAANGFCYSTPLTLNDMRYSSSH